MLNINQIFIGTSLVFAFGIVGVILNRKNVLMVLICIEILLVAVNLNFAILSIYLDDIVGHICVLFILTIAAVESALGLGLITSLYKLQHSIDIQPVKQKFNYKI